MEPIEKAFQRWDRLQVLENELREAQRKRRQVGFALKEIRDNELYKEDGFETFENYLKHFAKDRDIDRRQLEKLLRYADIQSVLPNNL
jgi:hypothetical protein